MSKVAIKSLLTNEADVDVRSYIKVLGEGDAIKVGKWLDQVNDGKAYLAVHGTNNKFILLRNGSEITFNHRSLSKVIEESRLEGILFYYRVATLLLLRICPINWEG